MKILGLLDTLESVILEGFKIPLTKKTIINEDVLLSLVDKMRVVISEQEKNPENKIMSEEYSAVQEVKGDNIKAQDIVKEAYEIAKEVRLGADRYADEVLSNLELTSTRILRTVKAGRGRLIRTVGANIGTGEEKIKA